LLAACRHGSKAGVTETYEGHQGPVTGISAHSVQGAVDFSHLVLTSSFDWTVKLWSVKENRPLYSFEDNGDYVYDVAWSPVHPALFATVDGTGRLDLWDLNQVRTFYVIVIILLGFSTVLATERFWGHVVAPLVETVCYKPEGSGF
jgi:WD40 repeat protein